jgi:Uma2 family endonuclease
MSAAPKPYYTPEQYLELERQVECKSEYYAGEIFAMAGGSPEHSLIAANVIAGLHPQLLGKPCRIYNSDLRVRTTEELYTYPDVTIVRGEPRFAVEDPETLVNPTLIVEVLSPNPSPGPSPARRGESVAPIPRRKVGWWVRFEQYRQRESLQEYVLVAQDRPHVERFNRQANGQWLLSEVNGLEAVMELPAIGCKLALAGVYHQVTFPAAIERPR